MTRRARFAFSLTFLLLPLWLLTPGCGDEPSVGPEDTAADAADSVDDSSLGDGDVTAEDTGADADEDTVEPIYPGNPCETDEECSTGLCYGTATKQGAFEPAECQTACLQPLDWDSYCNSDADCCGTNSCCLGCGEQEGLCLITIR